MLKNSRFLIVAVLSCLCIYQVSSAVIYPFEIFTTNGSYWDSPDVICEVDVTGTDGFADFTFYNSSDVDCVIAAIYFDDGSLLGIAEIINGPDVEFVEPMNSGTFPAGNELDPLFEISSDFSAKGVSPPPFNGINNTADGEPAEWLTVRFELINGGTVADVLNELDTGELRIGLHITSFLDGSSESAVSVPEPATLGLLALGGLFLKRRKR